MESHLLISTQSNHDMSYLDLVMEAGGDDPRAHGQLASLDLLQAAAPEQACHLVMMMIPSSSSRDDRPVRTLLLLPDRCQSLVAHCCAVVLLVGLSQVDP